MPVLQKKPANTGLFRPDLEQWISPPFLLGKPLFFSWLSCHSSTDFSLSERHTQSGLYWRAQQQKGSCAKEPYKTKTLVQKRPTQSELYWRAHNTKALLRKSPSIQASSHLGASPNQNDYCTILLISNHVESLESLLRPKSKCHYLEIMQRAPKEVRTDDSTST